MNAFEFDIFISYAHLDNRSEWIDTLHEELKKWGATLLAEEPRIWRDRKLEGIDYFDEQIEEHLNPRLTNGNPQCLIGHLGADSFLHGNPHVRPLRHPQRQSNRRCTDKAQLQGGLDPHARAALFEKAPVQARYSGSVNCMCQWQMFSRVAGSLGRQRRSTSKAMGYASKRCRKVASSSRTRAILLP